MLIGSLAGSDSLLRPLAALNTGGGSVVAEEHGLAFRRIKTTADLDVQRWQKPQHRANRPCWIFMLTGVCPVSRWRNTHLRTAGVQDALANAVLLQADVTANDEQDQALLKRFGVFGPPTIIFFGTDGMQRHGYEVVGYMKAKEFTEHVRMATGNDSTINARN